MKRRNVIKGVAAGGMTSVGLGSAAHVPAMRTGDVSQYDYLRVVGGGETVGRIDDPTWAAVREAERRLDDGQHLVTPDDTCTSFCRINCSCDTCLFGCAYCCNPSEDKCDCCSAFENPDEVACCEGC